MTMSKNPYVLAALVGFVTLAIISGLFMKSTATLTTQGANAPEVGTKPGERYHAVHVDRLQLKCDACHSQALADYFDPMAQVSNPVDKQACLNCHNQGSALPFYGDDWQNAKVSR